MQPLQPNKEATCVGKSTAPTMHLARKLAKKLNNKYDKAVVEPYKCRCCGKYHLGGNKQVTRRQRLAEALRQRPETEDKGV